jgi:hypothetical protein
MIDPSGTRAAGDESIPRDGIITGLLGAAIVALFYLAVDATRGRPLMTPSVLGQAFILHQPVTLSTPDPAAVLAYTFFHVVAFVAFGFLLAVLTRASEASSLARYAMVQLMVAFVIFFYGVVSIGSEVVRGMLPFIGVLVANGLAGVVMLGWLWRHHPRLRILVAQTPLGASDGRS